MLEQIEVVQAGSVEQALEAFATDPDALVVGGATIVMPELAAGRRRPARALLLHGAGLDAITPTDTGWRVGAGARLSQLAVLGEPIAASLAGIADPEVRAQATLGGNLCAPWADAAPRGDLQGPLVALGATVRFSDGVGEHEQPVADFLLAGHPRALVIEVTVPRAQRAAHAALHRPHSHGYTALAVSGAVVEGRLRLAATGLASTAIELQGADDPLDGEVADDALASAWYRREMVPVLARRCLDELEMAA